MGVDKLVLRVRRLEQLLADREAELRTVTASIRYSEVTDLKAQNTVLQQKIARLEATASCNKCQHCGGSGNGGAVQDGAKQQQADPNQSSSTSSSSPNPTSSSIVPSGLPHWYSQAPFGTAWFMQPPGSSPSTNAPPPHPSPPSAESGASCPAPVSRSRPVSAHHIGVSGRAPSPPTSSRARRQSPHSSEREGRGDALATSSPRRRKLDESSNGALGSSREASPLSGQSSQSLASAMTHLAEENTSLHRAVWRLRAKVQTLTEQLRKASSAAVHHCGSDKAGNTAGAADQNEDKGEDEDMGRGHGHPSHSTPDFDLLQESLRSSTAAAKGQENAVDTSNMSPGLAAAYQARRRRGTLDPISFDRFTPTDDQLLILSTYTKATLGVKGVRPASASSAKPRTTGTAKLSRPTTNRSRIDARHEGRAAVQANEDGFIDDGEEQQLREQYAVYKLPEHLKAPSKAPSASGRVGSGLPRS